MASSERREFGTKVVEFRRRRDERNDVRVQRERCGNVCGRTGDDSIFRERDERGDERRVERGQERESIDSDAK